MIRKVAIVMGSGSDAHVAQDAIKALKRFGVPYTVHVMSAHRSPEAVRIFSASAVGEGYGVIIAIAGKAAHLPGVIASHTILPVIGVPVKSEATAGMDALLSMAQMPSGVPVATVALDGGFNAAILAVQMLALGGSALRQMLDDYKEELAKGVTEANAALQKQLSAD